VAKKPKSTRRSWAKDEIRALKQMVKENVIASEIALKLERTVAAVYRKAGILDISFNAARKRRNKAKKV
jgi:predicted transport protein